ncbi:MAG: 30S ribosomal protein S3 [Planctomycetota bacterium]|jgi:small subunit ribosomal protein S3|nr:30S ribosomal protein S3 [Planctomycetota bacterium]
MGHKVCPIGLRIGITQEWRSRWYAPKALFGKYLLEDQRIRKHIKKEYRYAMISKIEIERTRDDLKVIIFSARPGVIIGKRGVNVDKLRTELAKITGREVMLDIHEVSKPDLDAQLVAERIADQLEKRSSFRRTMKKAAEDTIKAGAKGVKVNLAGRLGGADMSRTESTHIGALPLSSLRAMIDYGFTEARTTAGNIGVKCWVYTGMKVDEPEEVPHGADAKAG